MTASKPFSLELTIQESRGLLGRVGHATMSARFCMVHAPDSMLGDAHVSFVARQQDGVGWRSNERQLLPEEALEVAERIEALGMPAREPDVTQVLDTSNSWTNLLLRVKKDEHVSSFEIGMQCSGFEGDDADALRHLLKKLCSLAGYHGMAESIVGSMPVQPPPPPVTTSTWSAPKFCGFCGQDVHGEYPEDGGRPCANDACKQPLLPMHSTCQQTRCGHIAPVATSFCWVCGASLRAD